MRKFLKQHQQLLILAFILLVASFLRFYRLPEYMTFLGDEGRDVLMVKRILVDHDIPLIGPPTSVGSMYLGPLYYYMMAISMIFPWLNPVSAAFMNALIGISTVFLVFYLAKRWFGFVPAALSSFLYAISPVTIIYSRSSWNPNPAPFFALLMIVGLDKARETKNFWWFALSGVALAFAIQMHYLALILLPILGILWGYELLSWIKGEKIKNLWMGTFSAAASFLVLMSPLVIFDFKYNFMNWRAVSAMFSSQSGSAGIGMVNFNKVGIIFNDLLVRRFMAGDNGLVAGLLSLLIISAIFLVIIKKKVTWPYFALGIWLTIGLIGLSFYHFKIYDHYLGFLNPVPYLLLGAFVCNLKGRWVVVASILLALLLAPLNIVHTPLFSAPNDQLKKTQEIAKYVIEQSNNKPFNFALLAKSNYDSAYQFYLDQYGHKPKVVPIDITDQLFVVCEDKDCNPTNNPKYEIAGFGMSKVESMSEFAGVKVYKLVSNPTGKP